MILVDVIAHRTSVARFAVPSGTKKEVEDAIAEKIRSGDEVVWADDPEGINVVCVLNTDIWRPRRRFKPRVALSRPDP